MVVQPISRLLHHLPAGVQAKSRHSLFGKGNLAIIEELIDELRRIKEIEKEIQEGADELR